MFGSHRTIEKCEIREYNDVVSKHKRANLCKISKYLSTF